MEPPPATVSSEGMLTYRIDLERIAHTEQDCKLVVVLQSPGKRSSSLKALWCSNAVCTKSVCVLRAFGILNYFDWKTAMSPSRTCYLEHLRAMIHLCTLLSIPTWSCKPNPRILHFTSKQYQERHLPRNLSTRRWRRTPPLPTPSPFHFDSNLPMNH